MSVSLVTQLYSSAGVSSNSGLPTWLFHDLRLLLQHRDNVLQQMAQVVHLLLPKVAAPIRLDAPGGGPRILIHLFAEVREADKLRSAVCVVRHALDVPVLLHVVYKVT